MDDFQSVSLPPFLSKTYEMVDDLSTDSIVSWSGTNKSFIVWNPPEFARDLLPKYFKHNNFSSFIRQLNTYGFRKIDPEQWEFANDDFVRGQPQLMRNIHRRKPVHSHSMVQGQGNSSLSELERQEMKDKIERLQHEKEVLSVELQRHEQERQGMELQMKFLKDRLQHMQRQQHTMASFVARILQKPELASNPVPPQFELHERKRRLPRSGSYDETSRIGSWESVARGNMDQSHQTGKLMQLETFLTFWEDTIRGDDVVDHNQLQVSSNLELHESTSCAESQAVSCTQLSTVEKHSRSLAIDPNSGPAAAVSATPSETIVSDQSATSIATEIDATKQQPSKEQTARTSKANTNDGFWEQFLMENPGSLDSPEAQLERKNFDCRNHESKLWWDMRNVNNLTEQMGHLSPVEKT